MDPQTGKIYRDLSPRKLRKLEKDLGRQLVPLTDAQANELQPLSNRMRKRLLGGYPCLCASGKSFKKCCQKRYEKEGRI